MKKSPTDEHDQILETLSGFWPLGFNALFVDERLKAFKTLRDASDSTWPCFCTNSEACEAAGGFSDSPFHRVQAVTTVGDVRCTDVLTGSHKILDTYR